MIGNLKYTNNLFLSNGIIYKVIVINRYESNFWKANKYNDIIENQYKLKQINILKIFFMVLKPCNELEKNHYLYAKYYIILVQKVL